jgi:cullin 3
MSKKGAVPYLRAVISIPKDQAEELWKSLDNSISLIFDLQASKLSFEELYRKAYDLVIQKYGELLYNGLKETIGRQCAHIVHKLLTESQNNFFDRLISSWTDFKTAINMIKDILMYMDRNYVLTKNLMPVYELGLSIFKNIVILNADINNKIKNWILDNIKNDRNLLMMSTEKFLIKSVISMLAEANNRDKNIYVNTFEIPFLEESKIFYTHEAQAWISTDSCSEYLKKVERRLKEEKERVESIMELRTEPLILKIIDECFIKTYSKVLVNMENSGCAKMMENSQLEDLKRMYQLFSRVPECLKEISSCVSKCIETEGFQIISTSEHRKNSTQLMNDLLKLREKFDTILNVSFDKDFTIQTTMKLSFENCINKNTKTSIALTLYTDFLLKKGIKGMDENTIDHTFDQIVLLFRYINAKDVFESFYKLYLGRRLLNSQSLSDDAEKLMIKKLKIECGSHYTSKMEGMLIDMSLSKDSVKEYIPTVDSNIEFKVLTAAFWPQDQIAPIILPGDFSAKMERFRRFYINRYSDRTLFWKTNLGSAEIRAYLGELNEKHELIVSTYQMAVLLLYNDRETYRYDEIISIVNSTDPEFEYHVMGLLKTGVICKNTPEKKLELHTELFINPDYKNKMFRIKVPVLLPKELVEDNINQEIPEVVEDDRKHMIEASIVKIMKSRRFISHQQLISEVSKLVLWKFIASPKQIKGRIENLIEREFLQRDPKDSNMYLYIV